MTETDSNFMEIEHVAIIKDKSTNSSVKGLRIAGAIATLVGLVLTVVTTASPAQHADTRARFLKQRKANLTYKGPGMVRNNTEFGDYSSEIFDFSGFKQRIVCAEYRGVDHPNARGCCPEKCGRKYCGTAVCAEGPGGADACCESKMPRVYCGPTQMAPCMINAKDLVDNFQDKRCLKHNGIDSVDHFACCPAACGEFCGAKFCDSFNPVGDRMKATECCPKDYSTECKAGVKAPCYFPGRISYKLEGYEANVTVATHPMMQMRPIYEGSYSFHAGPPTHYVLGQDDKPLPKWCSFSTSTGVLQCDFKASGYAYIPAEKLFYKVKAKSGLDEVESRVFVPFANPLVKLHYAIPHSFKGDQQLLPHVECAWSSTVAKDKIYSDMFRCKPDYTIEPDLPSGLRFDAISGEINGNFAMFPQEKEQKYTITARSKQWEKQSTSFEFSVPAMALIAPLELEYVGFPQDFASNQELKLVPHHFGGLPSHYAIEPEVPKGYKLNASTGVLKGRFGDLSNTKLVTFTLIAENSVGRATYGFDFPKEAPLSLHYNLPDQFVSDKKLRLPPITAGSEPTHYTIEPSLPKGLSLDKATGIVHGVVKNPLDAMKNYTITGANAAGEVASVIQLPREEAPFPWWMVVVATLLVGLALWYFWPRPEPEPVYTPMRVLAADPTPVKVVDSGCQADPPPPPPPREGIPITFDTPQGEQTVWALKKPLGLEYDKKLPITISKDTSGHGKELGIKQGWVMKSVNEKKVIDLESFQYARKILQREVSKLPGSIPLTFAIDQSNTDNDKTVWVSKSGLGLEYPKKLPITIENVLDGHHGMELDIKPGWILKAVNYRDVYSLSDYQEVKDILQDEMGILARRPSVSSEGSGYLSG